MSNLLKDNKELMKEYDYEKNQDILLDNITTGSSKKIWWKCLTCDNKWQAAPYTRKKGHGCPYCSGRVPIKGINDLATTNPNLLKEWDYKKNTITPSDVGKNSSMKVWWRCPKNHSYESYVSNRTNHNTGCPYCANKKVLKGFNDIESFNPILASEWNKEKNSKLKIDQFTYTSNKKVWWKCSKCGNEWEASINHRTIRNHGCPYCSGRVAIKGINDLATTNPNLLKEWDYEKNSISPNKLKLGSHNQVWWKCSICNGSWQAPIYNRTTGNGCPYCANKKVLEGFNDLETIRPDIAIEWDSEKNGNNKPNQFLPGSDQIVWWRCPNCNYEWQSKITVRTSSGTGCPNCSKYHSTSFPEQALMYYLKTIYPNVINRAKFDGIESDIFISELNVGIEYDGFQWHKDILDRDNKKDYEFKNNKIKLIRIRENGLKKTKYAKNIFRSSKSISNLEFVINEVFKCLKIPTPNIDIKRDRNDIISQYITYLKNNNLESYNSFLTKEWNYERNGKLLPKMVSPFSNEKVWWKCSKCGNEWEAVISTRSKGSNCPICANEQRQKTRRANMIKAGRSLASMHPELLKEWDYKNNVVAPEEITYGSGKKVWWICSKCGQRWESAPLTRSKGIGCPVCASKVIVKGINDLTTTCPNLIKTWNFKKNKVKPTEVSKGSSLKVWWICSKCGNEWEAKINKRVGGNGCPKCNGNKK